MIEVQRKEIYRYLGYRKIQSTQQIDRMIDACIEQMEKVLEPKHNMVFYPVSFPEKDRIIIGPMHITSKGLYRNLQNCDQVVLMAATIGMGIDRLIRRAEILNMVEAAIYQAAGAAYIEAYCDQINQDLITAQKAKGKTCRPRFSPGYGDFSLSYQTYFRDLLDMPRTVGISLTESLLMIPSKSVTAVIGISSDEKIAEIQGCASCLQADRCMYKEEL